MSNNQRFKIIQLPTAFYRDNINQIIMIKYVSYIWIQLFKLDFHIKLP